ncbi:MAG: methyltransferase domain-containing protein [Archaeoglobus sp.]|nr:methyltransferase domain-containing protein [Archaeoglobus sp.]
MIQKGKATLEATMEFIHSYLVLKSYYFGIKTGLFRREASYPNKEYCDRWLGFFEKADYDALLNQAFDKMRMDVDRTSLDLFDCMERSSYFALVHPNHPNITLGFIKDADLWDLWLKGGVFELCREIVAEKGVVEKGLRVLDLGCGSVSPLYYSKLVGNSGVYAGVELSAPLAKLASFRLRENFLDQGSVRQEDAEKRLYFKRKYDVVLISFLLENVSNRKAVLRNALEALEYEGRILISSFLFSDLEPDKRDLFELYFSLIPSFKGFPSLSEIFETLEFAGVSFRYNLLNNNMLEIEIGGE